MLPRTTAHKMGLYNQGLGQQKKFAVPADYRSSVKQQIGDLQKNFKSESNTNDGRNARESSLNSDRITDKQQGQQIISNYEQNTANDARKNMERFQKVREIAEELSKSNSKSKIQEKKDFGATNPKKFQRSKGSEISDDKPEYSSSLSGNEASKKDSKVKVEQQTQSNVYTSQIPILKQQIIRRESNRSSKNYQNQIGGSRNANSQLQPQPIVLSDLKSQRDQAAVKALAKSKSSENFYQFKQTETRVSRNANTYKASPQFESHNTQQTNNFKLQEPPKEMQFTNTFNSKGNSQNTVLNNAQKTQKQTLNTAQQSKKQSNQEISPKDFMKLEEKDYIQKYVQSQNQRSELAKENAAMKSTQMGLKSEIQMLKTKNLQLQKQSRQYQQLAFQTNMQTNNKISQNQRIFNDLNEKNEQITKKLYDKMKECNQLKVKYQEIKSQATNIESRARNNYNLQDKHREEIQRLKHTHQIQIQQALLTANDKIIQLQQQIINLKANPNFKREEDTSKIDKLKQQIEEKSKIIKRMETEINALKIQLKEKIEMEIELQTNITQRQKIYAQVNRLSALLSQETAAKSQIIKSYELKLLQKDHKIQQLQTTLVFEQQQSKSVNFAQKFQNPASTTTTSAYNDFSQQIQTMIRQHTQQIADLRNQIASREEDSYKFRSQNQNSKNQIRRLQQQLKMIKMTTASNIQNITQAKKNTQLILKSQVDNAKRRAELLQKQMHQLQLQVQQKDAFIKKNIISMDKNTSGQALIAKLQQALQKK